MENRTSTNDLVLARMRVQEFIDGDEEALDKLDGLSFEAKMSACLEALATKEGS